MPCKIMALTIYQETCRKSANTKRLVKTNGLTGYDEQALKLSNALLTIQDSGLTLAKEIGKKVSVKLNTMQSNGLTIAQEFARKSAATRKKINVIKIIKEKPSVFSIVKIHYITKCSDHIISLYDNFGKDLAYDLYNRLLVSDSNTISYGLKRKTKCTITMLHDSLLDTTIIDDILRKYSIANNDLA